VLAAVFSDTDPFRYMDGPLKVLAIKSVSSYKQIGENKS